MTVVQMMCAELIPKEWVARPDRTSRLLAPVRHGVRHGVRAGDPPVERGCDVAVRRLGVEPRGGAVRAVRTPRELELRHHRLGQTRGPSPAPRRRCWPRSIRFGSTRLPPTRWCPRPDVVAIGLATSHPPISWRFRGRTGLLADSPSRCRHRRHPRHRRSCARVQAVPYDARADDVRSTTLMAPPLWCPTRGTRRLLDGHAQTVNTWWSWSTSTAEQPASSRWRMSSRRSSVRSTTSTTSGPDAHRVPSGAGRCSSGGLHPTRCPTRAGSVPGR